MDWQHIYRGWGGGGVVVVVVSGIKIFPVNHRLTKDTDDGSTIRPAWCSVVFLPAD